MGTSYTDGRPGRFGVTTHVTKEQLYDEKMSPLVAELIRLAKEHDIPMFASFQLNDTRPCSDQDDGNPGLLCTTSILPADAHKGLHACHQQVRRSQEPRVLAFTITSAPKPRVH